MVGVHVNINLTNIRYRDKPADEKSVEMIYPVGFEDEDEYDGEYDEEEDFDYDEEDYFHHPGFDDLFDDVGEDYDYDVWRIQDLWIYVKDHEMILCEYSPESKEVEGSTVLDVLKVAEMTIKLVEALKLRLDSEERDRYIIVAWGGGRCRPRVCLGKKKAGKE